MSELVLHSRHAPSGSLLTLDPKRAQWELLSFDVIKLLNGQSHEGATGANELSFVFLSGRGSVHSSRGNFEDVGGRQTVFEGSPHSVYLPPETRFTLTASTEVEVAICRAPASRTFPAAHVKPEQVPIEARGGGNASRTIRHVLPPEFPADKLMIVEVLTPPGNWSSVPPHKHDRHAPPAEYDLEEIYYYRINPPTGFAFQRVYTDDRRVDETIAAQDGDLVLIREGYHPVAAAPGCEVYYLNALAGSGRSMAATDDPAFAWIRDTWKTGQAGAAR